MTSRFYFDEDSHPGIVAIQQQSLGIGERMRRLLKLWSRLSAEQMANRIEFLSHWGER